MAMSEGFEKRYSPYVKSSGSDLFLFLPSILLISCERF